MLTSAPKEDNKFLSRGRNSWAYTKKVTKYKE